MSTKSLTWREQEIECIAARDLTYEDIAAHLAISPNTVKTHFESLMAKRGASRRQDLKRQRPRKGDFVGYIGPERQHRKKTWEIFDFETDDEGQNAAVLIDPTYDGPAELEPLLRVIDPSELFVIDA